MQTLSTIRLAEDSVQHRRFPTPWIIAALLLSIALAVFAVPMVYAHAADMLFHTIVVSVSATDIRITWDIVPGPTLSEYTWYSADTDLDGAVSSEEAESWAKTASRDLAVDLSGVPLSLCLQSVAWPVDSRDLTTGETPIHLELAATLPQAAGQPQELTITNTHNRPSGVTWFELHGEEDVHFGVPNQDGGVLQALVYRSEQRTDATLLADWESGRPRLPWLVESMGLGDLAEDTMAGPPAQSGTTGILEGLVKRQATSPAFVAMAMAVAAFLGALHALSPGHGKTIVAAYLVGSQGKPYHAIALGAIVTVTHTGTVFLLGVLTVTASRYLVTTRLFPILELASASLIVLLGVGLLVPRLRNLHRERARRRERKPSGLPQAATGENGRLRLTINQTIEEAGPPHSHGSGATDVIPRRPIPGNPLSAIRWRSLITLGVSGGLVPCPDAIAILLAAVAVNRVVFGLSLIVAFSAGLAVVLISIGLLVVQGRRLFARLRWFDQVAAVMPVLSALVVLGLGTVLMLSALRGMQDTVTGSSISGTGGSTFNLDQAQVLYRVQDDNQTYQLFVVPAIGGAPRQITDNTDGVWDFAVSPKGSKVIYSVALGTYDNQVWLWTPSTDQHTLLMTCEDAWCHGFTWSPDEQGVLYSRLELGAKATSLGFPSIWWLDTTTKTTDSLFEDASMPGTNPRLSPDGAWLSYTSANPQAVQIYHIATGTRYSLPSQLGSAGVWSPDSASLLFVDFEESETVAWYRLFRYNLADQTLTAPNSGEACEENQPAWSADGMWIAEVRQNLNAGDSPRGAQIWLMRPDGSEAHPLTDDPSIDYDRLSWSADGRYLLGGAKSITLSGQTSAIHIVDVETGDVREIAAPGNRPVWLP